MNSNRSTTREWIQRSATAALAATLAVSTYTPSMAHASDKSNTGTPTINTQTGLTAPTTKSFAPKKLGGGVVITRKTKTVKVILKHKQSRKAKLKAYNASAKRWALVTRGKTTNTRAVWKVAPTSTRVKVRVGAMKSGTLTIPGAPSVNSKPNNPTKPNPGTADPTNPPKGKTPPPLSPSDSWDWDEYDNFWRDFECDYNEARGYGAASPWMALYQVFCDPWTSTTGMASPQNVYSDTISSCVPLRSGKDGVVYEIPYTIQLRDIRIDEGEYTNFATWGRSDIQAHDIVPGSAHLDSSGRLAYTQRTRSIPATQGSVTIVLPFYESRAVPLEGGQPYPRVLSTSVEDAYSQLSESMTKGSNMKPILSWVPVGTAFRPASWERDVWGVPGVNGRTQGVGWSRGWDDEWSRQYNVASFDFEPAGSAFTEYAPVCNA